MRRRAATAFRAPRTSTSTTSWSSAWRTARSTTTSGGSRARPTASRSRATRTPPASRSRRATSRRSAPAAPSTRAAATPTRGTAGTRAARSSTAGFLHEESGNDEYALTYFNQGELRLHPRGGQGVHELRPLLLLNPRLHLAEPLLQVGGSVRRHQEQRDRRPGRWDSVGDDLRPGHPQGRHRALLRLGPALRGALRFARGPVDQPDHALLRGLRHGHAAEYRDRRPAVQGRGRRRRPLRRRASSRRRPPRAGIHGRRGQRLHQFAQLPQARRAVHHLRRVGRLLRPRAPAARDRRPRQPGPERGLRPDGLPHPAVAVSPLRNPQTRRWRLPRRPRGLRARVDPQAHLSTASASASSTSATSTRATSATASTGRASRTSIRWACPTRPRSSRSRAALGGGDMLRPTPSRPTRTTSPTSRKSPSASACRSSTPSRTSIFTQPDSWSRRSTGSGGQTQAAAAPAAALAFAGWKPGC